MNYWQGFMNWGLQPNWTCETCGEYAGLTWGMVHAQCRCNKCHTEYRMRNKKDEIVTQPISQLKDEYKEPAKNGWQKYGKPIDEFTDNEWDEVIAKISV